MIRSMYSGISGMKNFQTKLDVIGNNIANVNTFGFKKGRVVFKDMVSQTISGASGPTEGKGGVNAKQIGLGGQLAAISTVATQGSLQTTGRVLDLAIQGEGFLVVAEGTPVGSDFIINSSYYTRAGNLYLNNSGYLVTNDGHYVMARDPQNPNQLQPMRLNDGDVQHIKTFSISENGQISYIINESLTEADKLKEITAKVVASAKNMFDNPNESNLDAIFSLSYALEDAIEAAVTKEITAMETEAENLVNNTTEGSRDGDIAAAALAKVNNAGAFANDIPEIDELKSVMNAVQTAFNALQDVDPDADNSTELGALNGELKALLEAMNDAYTKVAALADATKSARDAIDNIYAKEKGLVRDGELYTTTASIALASFPNSGGLQMVGDNMFTVTASSGNPNYLVPGTAGVGTLVSGALEMSNVDLSEEFAEMIVAQRGFQANTRIITTSDEILQELVNLKR